MGIEVRDEEDFQMYLTIIESRLIYYSSYNYRLAAYCLMDNYIYIMVKRDNEPLKNSLKGLIQCI